MQNAIRGAYKHEHLKTAKGLGAASINTLYDRSMKQETGFSFIAIDTTFCLSQARRMFKLLLPLFFLLEHDKALESGRRSMLRIGTAV
jgi:hypothetical protein